MSKTAIFAVSCSIVVLAFFTVSCYLMSIVNPPPIVEATLTNTTKKDSKFGENLANFYRRNMPTDDLEYGMEKVYKPFVSHSSAPLHHRTNFTDYPDIPNAIIKNPHLVKVYPPIWPPKTTSNLTSKEFKQTTKDTAGNHKENTNNDTKVESPIHRRSINVIEKNIDKNTGAVILKILDNDGKSRIEIKLSPNNVNEKKKSRLHRSFPKTDILKDSVELSNTEIRILPNDTVIINNNNDSSETIDVRTNNSDVDYKSTDNSEKVDLTNILYHIESSTAHIYVDNKAIGTTTNIINHNKPVTKAILGTTERRNTTEFSKEIMNIMNTKNVFGLKVLFDNVTRSFTDPYHDNVLKNKTR